MPEPADLNVSFSFGGKKNLGNYENADYHISRSERWNVADLAGDDAAISAFYAERYAVVREEVLALANHEWKELGG